MRRKLLALAAALLAAGTALADVTVEDAWVRATVPGQKSGGAFMKLTASADTTLVGARSPVAGIVEIHEMAMNNGVMSMRGLPDGVELKPGAKLELKPGGYHIMFMDLKRQLKEGETIKGTLTFEKAGAVPVEFSVQSVGARAPAAAHKH